MSEQSPPQDRPQIKCPHCTGKFHVENIAKFVDGSELGVSAESSTGCFEASQIAGIVENTAGLLTAISENMGEHVMVFVTSIGIKEKRFSVRLKVARIEKKDEEPK